MKRIIYSIYTNTVNNHSSVNDFKKSQFEKYKKQIKKSQEDYAKLCDADYKLYKTRIVDYDKIQFPITYRNYSEGDSFSPLGMRNQKKVSSYISDIKLNYIDKIHQLVLEDNKNNIVWLVGQQISDKYKVDNYTKKILNLEII